MRNRQPKSDAPSSLLLPPGPWIDFFRRIIVRSGNKPLDRAAGQSDHDFEIALSEQLDEIDARIETTPEGPAN
jgi:hypothetical protein